MVDKLAANLILRTWDVHIKVSTNRSLQIRSYSSDEYKQQPEAHYLN